ncbi:hypothetical protein D9756_004061 [Leucocoprinus leucothites]|uniref:Pentatricopeptide repeat-containing protein n=1 Tax=Leucocoprinus leucothites TaxID=201217 RepID=A0A8H5G0R0_9AGAR|nr:hypothetical protein D9756_004061 [Leucoagaricus leucothites]
MLRHASTQARQALILDFLAPFLIRPTPRLYSTNLQKRPQNQQSSQSTQKPSFPAQTSSPSSLIAKLTTIHDENANSPGLSTDKIEQFNKTIVDIRWTLSARRHPNELLKLWRQLDDLKVVHMLGLAQLAPLSTLMIETFLKAPSTTVKKWNRQGSVKERGEGRDDVDVKERSGLIGLDPSLEKTVRNIALLASMNDSWDAIIALMEYYIREGDAKAVLDLYEKFTTLVGDRNLTMDQELQNEASIGGEEEGKGEQGTEQLLATETELKQPGFPPRPTGRVHLLMAVVTAHAMNNSFRAALDACKATVVQLDEKRATAFINQALRHDSSLRNKVRHYYLPRLLVASLVSRPAVFVHYVTRLGNPKSTASLIKLYETIKSGLDGEDMFLAADPSLVTETKTIALTTVGWTALLSAFLKCERKDLAGRLWDDMTRLGVPIGISMWTVLLDTHGQVGAAGDALATWRLMLRKGVQPDTLAYRAIIAALFKGRHPDEAMEIFKQYESLPIEQGTQRLSLYNTVCHELLALNHEEEAVKVREEMEKKGPQPDMVTYNAFINYHARRRNFQGIATTLRVMQAAGFEGDVFTYTTILSALLKTGNKDAADLVLALMDKQGVKKNYALYTSLIDHQLREGGEANFQVAMKMLASMEKDAKNPPTEITYTAVLCGLYRLSWMDPDDLKQIEAQIIQRIRHRGLSLGLPAYHLLLKACLVYPHENGVQQALAYYEEMKKREIPLINTTWYILLAGLLHKGEWTIADKMVEEMYASGIHPAGSLLRLVHQISNRING